MTEIIEKQLQDSIPQLKILKIVASKNNYVHRIKNRNDYFTIENLTIKFLVSLYYIAYYVYKCLISGFDLLQFLLVQDMQRNDFSVKF